MKSGKRRMGFMAFSTYFRIASQLLVFLVLARLLGAEQFGLFSYWFSVTSLIAIPVNYGFGIQLLREAAKDPQSRQVIMDRMLAAKLVLTLAVLLVCAPASVAVSSLALFWLLLFTAIAESYVDFCNFALRSQDGYAGEARVTFVASLLQLILVSAVALASAAVIPVAAAYCASRCAALLLTYRMAYGGRRRLPLDFSAATLCATLRSGFPYAADMGVSTFNNAIDIILLKQMSSVRSVGIYQAGLRLMMGGTTPAMVVSNVYLPKVSALDSEGREYRLAVADLNLKMVALGGGISLLLALFSGPITTLFFGPEYAELALLLPWFALVLVLRYVAASFGINLTAAGHQSVRVVANLIYLAVFAVAALLLIPPLQGTGALMAGACAMLALISGYLGYSLWKRLPSGYNLSSSSVFAGVIGVILFIILGNLR